MTLNDLKNDFLIDLIIESEDNSIIMKSVAKMNTNIRRSTKGARIKPQIESGKINRAILKKILKLATPAELEILATQFLGKNGLKVAKGNH